MWKRAGPMLAAAWLVTLSCSAAEDGVTVIKIGPPAGWAVCHGHPGRAWNLNGSGGVTAPPRLGQPWHTGPVVPPASVQAIDLPEALRLAGADNPTIALAREAIQAARAELLGARALLLPTLNAGFTYDYHDGNLLA